MKKKVIFFYLFICLNISVLFAQNSLSVRGFVKDIKSGEPLVGAIVGIKGTTQGAPVDYEGAFLLKTKLPLPLTLVVSYIGYQTKEITIKEFSKPIEIRLAENAKILKEISVKDSRITAKQKQAPLTIETMDAIAIKETPAANFYEGLAHLKGVDLTSASIGFKIINTRGFNSTSPVRSLQLIDGVDNQAPGLNFSLGNFLGSSELDVQKVDLIVGASGAYYGPNAFNGVINMLCKSPFLYPGLSVQLRLGERRLTETAIRYAEVFKNKKGEEKLAYKLNIFTMSAYDWEATNYSTTIQSPVPENNPGGYDAVNIYGDEFSSASYRQTGLTYLGYGTALRTGYKEINLVDYNTRNLKMNAAVHYKFSKNNELIVCTNFGNGTTVYQGDNRFSLKDILFFQNRIEIRKEGKYFIRAYNTSEDAGKSFDAYATALLLQDYAKSENSPTVHINNWAKDYAENWNALIYNKIQVIRPPIYSAPPGMIYEDYANYYLNRYYHDSLVKYHKLVREITDSKPSLQTGGLPRFEPGTERYDSAYKSIISLTNRNGGSRFFDKSALYHVAGEYQLEIKSIEIKVGGNFRLYAPYSKGTIFLDTADKQRIYNREAGAYLGLEKKIIDNKMKLSFTNRIDKNENFQLLWSPAASVVYVHDQHVFRFSAASAIRNPTLTDQYINLNVGRATLLGNLNGFDSLVTIESLLDAFNNGKQKLSYFNVAPIKPEKVKTVEIGYRGNLGEKFFVDVSYYFSWYQDFIGYKIGAKVDWDGVFPNTIKVYRVSANAIDIVTTQGFSIGLNYFYTKSLSFSGNYSWNKLDLKGLSKAYVPGSVNSLDPLIPAYNTPEHKYNLGLSGRDINTKIGSFKVFNWGYGINWKWQTGFKYEGSPQFTGDVPAYGMLDAQVNKSFIEDKLTVKIGANNVLNNKVIQVFGGPLIGRMAYVSLLFDFGN
ncbi:MAG: carboxypeptidase-like regulatory domain-containing protein [Bacteroidota bacterium]|nr:carboxypeptidase-like regulatory domain-containing protein [Bacteroidota bacterium]